jgi:hypothetical protein
MFFHVGATNMVQCICEDVQVLQDVCKVVINGADFLLLSVTSAYRMMAPMTVYKDTPVQPQENTQDASTHQQR